MLGGVLLERILNLKDSSPLIVVNDSIRQGGRGVLQLFESRIRLRDKDANIIYVAFEGTPAPVEANSIIDCCCSGVVELKEIQSRVIDAIRKTQQHQHQHPIIIMIDSLNYISSGEVAPFLSSLIRPGITIVSLFHRDLPFSSASSSSSSKGYYPTTERLVNYLATSILCVEPAKDSEEDTDGPEVLLRRRGGHTTFVSTLEPYPCGNDASSYRLSLIHRRKSGRSITASFLVSERGDKITLIGNNKPHQDSTTAVHEATFNLTLSDKQREQKDKVNLPFMAAQQVGSGGVQGGAIVYQYEKEDDYDEEDPYEDPF